MKIWLLRHVQVLLGSLGQMTRTPVATAMTLAMMGVTLALPALLYVMVENVQRLSRGLDSGGQISVYLNQGLTESAGRTLAHDIQSLSGVARVRYISRNEALTEFRQYSGFGAALEHLPDNPLPAVVVVKPAAAADIEQLAQLRATLAGLRGVSEAELDLGWIRRLQAMLAVGTRGVWLLASFLALAVLLIVGNTIRLSVLSRQTEIEIVQLVGGTPAFIRRPFLYAGTWLGLLGGITAWILVEIGVWVLDGPVQRLAALYASDFSLSGLDVKDGMFLLVLGAGLGWLGSRIAVTWHLARLRST